MDKWLRRFTRIGVRRGMRGSRPWLATAAVSIGLRGLRRMAHPPEKVLYRTKIASGDMFEVAARPRARTGRRRRNRQ